MIGAQCPRDTRAEIQGYRAEQRVDPDGSCILSKGSIEVKHLEQRRSMSSFDFIVERKYRFMERSWRWFFFFFAVIQVRSDGGPNLMS